jgi:hypothetical protein
MNIDPRLHPPPDAGVHAWLFGRAVRLRRIGRAQLDALSELSAHVAGSTFRAGRVVTSREIADAVESAYRGALAAPSGAARTLAEASPSDAYTAAVGWPADMHVPRAQLSRERIRRVLAAAGNFELVDLWSASPVRPPDYPAPRWALDQLFAPDDLLCIGASSSEFAARPLREWTDAGLLTQQLIVPNPLRKRSGTTKSGTESAHSRDATGPRRYIIFESDAGLSIDEQAGIVEFIRTRTVLPLAAAVLSGGKSLHAWFRCVGVPDDYLRHWFQIAVTLGADPRLWLPEQFVRLPDGRRDSGARQNLIYLSTPDTR